MLWRLKNWLGIRSHVGPQRMITILSKTAGPSKVTIEKVRLFRSGDTMTFLNCKEL
jgi:hypothetical protein